MGKDIDRSDFSEDEYWAFNHKLHHNLDALRKVISLPNFGSGPQMIGAELELYLIDKDARPSMSNVEVQQQFASDQLTLELNRYNIEYNLKAVPIKGRCFNALEKEMISVISRLNELADGAVIPIGILPTLSTKDFGPGAMTDLPRYHALAKILQQWRGGKGHKVKIEGLEEVEITSNDITLEGACTSFQVHYKMSPERFVDLWNAAQLVTPLVLALSANSSFVLGKMAWQETRIPLFKQSIDGRRQGNQLWRDPSRVYFGNGWLRNSAYELFAQNVYLFPSVIPICYPDDPLETLSEGKLPTLEELCLHNGTVWSWNRAIYCTDDSGHIRMELRSLPAGPTAVDMVANAALMIGLMEGLFEQINLLIDALPFHYAEHNFYRAAQYGLEAQLIWPSTAQNGLAERSVTDILWELLPKAADGLKEVKVSSLDINNYLGVVEKRLEARQTGATWQLINYQKRLKTQSKRGALKSMVNAYRDLSLSNLPVGEWPCR